jgi:hypothetical protein
VVPDRSLVGVCFIVVLGAWKLDVYAVPGQLIPEMSVIDVE